MKSLEYLFGPTAPLFWPGVAAGALIALQGAILSVLVVLKRMAFIGQGVSHAAFGGIGLAAFLGLAGGASFPLIAGFCIASAWGIALLSGRERGGAGRRRADSTDTVIGVFLVGAMALGAILVALRGARSGGGRAGVAWEQALFGSILAVDWTDAAIAGGSLVVTLGALAWWRRPLLFWAFDESAAEASGVPVRAMRLLLLTLLALAVVTAMKLAGVVLASALLTLPAAGALRLSRRLGAVIILACGAGLAGTALGLITAFEMNLPPGACIVAALIALYTLTWLVPLRRGANGQAMRAGAAANGRMGGGGA